MKARLVRCSTWLVAAGLLTAPAGAWSQGPPPSKRVLMLYGHDPNAPGAVAFTNELHATVRADSPTRVVFYDELLDLERFPEKRAGRSSSTTSSKNIAGSASTPS